MMRSGHSIIGGFVGTLFGYPNSDSDFPPYASLVFKEKGLLAYWGFEGNTQDQSGTFHGSVHGEENYISGAVGGSALSLAADDTWVSFGKVPELDLNAGSISLFFRCPEDITGNPCLIAKRTPAQSARFSIHLMGDRKGIGLWNSANLGIAEIPGEPLQPNRWYHLAVVFEAGQSPRVYLDGAPTLTTSHGGSFNRQFRELPLLLGAATELGMERFNGALDEVAIHSTLISGDTIAQWVDAAGLQNARETRQAAYAELAESRAKAQALHDAQNQQRIMERMKDPALLADGVTQNYTGDHREAISFAVGGIGTGPILFNGHAEPHAWQIFNNFNHVQIPHSFLALHVTGDSINGITRALQTRPVGPFQAMQDLVFSGEYPFALYKFSDDALPVRACLEVYNPFVPLNARDSAIPCVIYKVELHNTSETPVQVHLLASQQNAVGYVGNESVELRNHPGYGMNRNIVYKHDFGTVLHMISDKAEDAPGYGDMALLMMHPDSTGTATWNDLDDLKFTLESDAGFADAPQDTPPSSSGTTYDGSLLAPVELAPNAHKTVTLVLTWHFPNVHHGQPDSAWKRAGNKYNSWWKNAMDVAMEIAERHEALYLATSNYHKSLYETNLPHWLLDRISSQVAILRSRTCFWAEDGYFGGWEGCGAHIGCCQGNCSHVWHYAQAHARLFPEIGRQMREQALSEENMQEDGAILFRQFIGMIAADGQTGEILGTYREYLTCRDNSWLEKMWPQVERAMEYVINTWDADEDGVLSGVQHNTLDTNLGGSTTWMGSLYLAALAACNRMAGVQGKQALATRYLNIFHQGCRTQDETLYNGEYYTQIPDETPLFDYNNGCHIDQVLGQWWAHQLNLGWLYQKSHVQSALRSILKYNFKDNFQEVRQYPRQFVANEDPGVQMITWPKEDRPDPFTLYADEVMSGFEYSAAAAMIQAGLIAEGFTILHAVSQRYDGRLRTGLTPGDTASWGYSGNPYGDDECGKFYARAMSVWSVLLAAQGFIYDGPAGRIGFRPVWKPDEHTSFFTTAAGWGVFQQTRDSHSQISELHLRYGELLLNEIELAVPEQTFAAEVVVECCGANVISTHSQKGIDFRVQFEASTLLRAGDNLKISIHI